MDKDFSLREYFLEPSLPTVAELSYGYVGNNKNEFVKRVSNKAKKAAIRIINLLEKNPNSPAINVIRYQLIKSATSTSANYRAVCVSRSNKEFYAKICVVV
ncbi:MAG: four helix bundle protein, partial [Bacteroidota bacterium]